MHIVIDARFWGLENTGLGRYVMKITQELSAMDRDNTYSLLLRKKMFEEFETFGLGSNFQPVLAEMQHYSVKEQLQLPRILGELAPDLVHIPHFNIPVMYRGPMVVTIHDLIKQFSVGAQATTLPKPLYWIKWMVHTMVIRRAVTAARAIIVPSAFTKHQLLHMYGVNSQKVFVTHEAPEDAYYENEKNAHTRIEKFKIRGPFVIYTGNVYPHKNVKLLIEAIKMYNSRNEQPLTLAVVCARNVFRTRLETWVEELGVRDQVRFLGFVPDEDLRELYREAVAFVTPSLLEGFGLPGLEAMAAGTVVLSSNTASLPEIYGKAAHYFDPHKVDELVSGLEKISNFTIAQRQGAVKTGLMQAKGYSWKKTAEQTRQVYELAAMKHNKPD